MAEPLKRRQLPKLYACMTNTSLENMRNRALFSLDLLDANSIRRMNQALDTCIVAELRESGYSESSQYLADLIYDNVQLVNEDDLGIVVDLRKRSDYLEHISAILQKAEKEHDRGNTKRETLYLLDMARYFAEREKGILWLAEKFFLTAIAVSSQYLIDGGRQKACCKFHYAKFLLDKFPGLDNEEPFVILTEVRDSAIGKSWMLREDDELGDDETVFVACAIQLHRVLLTNARKLRPIDNSKAERLARLAERRARDANDNVKEAEAIIETGINQLMMNNLNNAQKTLDRALSIHTKNNNIPGICETKMHLAAVMQRLGEHEIAAKLLTDMGMMAMKKGLRKQLGRALHLLGELHLRRDKPELGTQHLSEAFMCFMGYNVNAIKSEIIANADTNLNQDISEIYVSAGRTVYAKEAEQSRFMTAISAGQELMASYFNLIKEAKTCAIAKMKVMEWKLNNYSWWVRRRQHDYLPCPCPEHNRTPLDVLRIRQEAANESEEDYYDEGSHMDRQGTITDIRTLHSSFMQHKKKETAP